MSSKPYKQFPTFIQWKKDSSVKLAKRSSDPILRRIDELVKANGLAVDFGAKCHLRCELFFCLDKWLEMVKRKIGNSGRKKAIESLYSYVAHSLCNIFHTTINVLPRELENMFGREMSDHGSMLDKEWDCANYLSRADAQKFSLRYKNGKVYQFPWWQSGKHEGTIVHAESSRAYVPGMFRDSTSGQYGGFAMSMSRTIYMAKHFCGPGLGTNANFYHSSYLAGEPVMCAGSLLIRNGRVLRLKTDSGHYQPTNTHMLNVINALKMFGVSTAELICVSHDGNWFAQASDFVRSSGNWKTLIERQAANLDHRNKRLEEKQLDEWLVSVWNHFQNEARASQHVQYYFHVSYRGAMDMIVKAYQRFVTHPNTIKTQQHQRALDKLHAVSL